MKPRVPDGRKMLIYERFFKPHLRYTLQEAYDFIEAEAPAEFKTKEDFAAFQQLVLERFPPMEPGEL
jgi:hypothetical protein